MPEVHPEHCCSPAQEPTKGSVNPSVPWFSFSGTTAPLYNTAVGGSYTEQ